MVQRLLGKCLQSECYFLKRNDLLQLEKPHSRDGDFCSDLSVLLLITKAQIWNVKEVPAVIFVF